MDTIETRLETRPSHISPEEWAVRVDLAACYRLVAHFGWDDLVLTHNTARVPGTTDQMLINPSGLMFDEITASNLLKVDITDGHLIEPSEYEPINAGVVIHGAIYLARPDVHCVIHTHTEADIAVGVLEEGLLPLSQWAMRFYGRLGYHDYEGVSLDMDERQRLAHDIGQHPVLVLRNHGLLATGRNVAEAFSLMYHFERSAEAQLKSRRPRREAARSSCRRPRPASGRRRSSPATCPVCRGSANGRRCCGCATASTRVTGAEPSPIADDYRRAWPAGPAVSSRPLKNPRVEPAGYGGRRKSRSASVSGWPGRAPAG